MYTLEERLLRRRLTDTVSNCWLFIGCITKKGYGYMYWNGKVYLVHRLSAYLYLGLDLGDKDTLVLHKNSCHNPKCFNPEHIYLGNNKDNQKDVLDYGNNPNFNKTHCPKGHKYTLWNTYITKDGKRQCLACHRIKDRDRRKKKLLTLENINKQLEAQYKERARTAISELMNKLNSRKNG